MGKYLIGDLVTGLYAAESLEDRFALFERTVQVLGFESCAYTFIPSVLYETSFNASPRFIHSDTFSSGFIEQYAYERFDKHDFTIKATKEYKLYPMDWQEYAKSDYLTDSEKSVLKLAQEDYQIKHGVSIPVMYEKIGMAGFSFTNSSKDYSFNALKQENLETLHLCSKAFNDIAFSRPYSYYRFIPKVLVNLTTKEKIVLRYVMQGKSMTDLGNSNEGISKRYGEKILLGLRDKFGNVSTHQLVNYVSQLNLI
ncbi:helix-turn-helix transcriptional regulator [Thiolinea disciformis]|uniref:helix-turn-helix transcriptional regulator n=1 Tax=Thiolinea disciformis TaxID=125614 RepID=UPI00036025AC|nr:autoinducer binding domain-containing protein [Thiolinea disciformis]